MNKIRLAVLLTAIAALVCVTAAVCLEDSDVSDASKNECTITYDLGGVSATNSNPTTVTSGSRITLADPVTDEDYTFAGWYNSALTQKYTKVSIRGDLTIYAVWYYTVEFHNVEDAVNNNYTKVYTGYSGTLKDASMDGYDFDGWYSDEEFTTEVTGYSGSVRDIYAKWVKLETRTITYHVLGETYTATYQEGEAVALDSIEESGYLYNGWLTSEGDVSTMVTSLSADVRGDLDLYAWLIPHSDIVGHGYTLDYKRTVTRLFNSSVTEGTSRTIYLDADDTRGFFAVNTFVTDDSSSVTSYWTNESESTTEFSYQGMKQVDTELFGTVWCEVYKAEIDYGYEYQYIYNGYIPVYIQLYQKSGWTEIETEFTISSVETIDLTASISVCGYGDAGLFVEGSGLYTIGDEVTLTVEPVSGTTFSGWHDSNGVLLSEETSYTFTAYYDMNVYAENSEDPDFTVDYETETSMYHLSGLTDLTWEVYNDSSGNAETYSGELTLVFDTGGSFTVYYSGTKDGQTYYGFYTMLVDGAIARTFTWVANGISYTYTLNILDSDYLAYKNNGCSRSYTSSSATAAFVTSSDKYVVEIADYIMAQTASMTETQRIMVALAFTQYIEYKYDSESVGSDEYWKFPLETLYEQNGDCEDTSILFCAIASAMGYRSALLMFNGHMAGSVAINDDSVTYSNPAIFPGTKASYYYCETTGTGYAVGQAPNGYTYKGTYYVYSDSMAITEIEPIHNWVHVSAEESESGVGYYYCSLCGETITEDEYAEMIDEDSDDSEFPVEFAAAGVVVVAIAACGAVVFLRRP